MQLLLSPFTKKPSVASFLLLFSFAACVKNSLIEKEEEPLICTEQFVSITIQIKGEVSLDHYTLRTAAQDTLRFEFNYENYYPVVNDHLVKTLEPNTEEEFVFVGIRTENNIREPYTITSDGCHVIKISGAESVN